MGKSFNNDIKISDTAEVTAKKIMSAVTDTNRIKKDDLGNPDNCLVAFKYWEIFGDETQIATVKAECQQGLRGCADCKRQLGCAVNEKLSKIRERRKYYEENPQLVEKIIKDGSKKARIEARKIINEIRAIIGMFPLD